MGISILLQCCKSLELYIKLVYDSCAGLIGPNWVPPEYLALRQVSLVPHWPMENRRREGEGPGNGTSGIARSRDSSGLIVVLDSTKYILSIYNVFDSTIVGS